MTFDGIMVNHAALESAGQQLVASAQQIDGRLNDLESQLAPLRSSWTGSAQESYHRAKATWDAAIADMIVLLRDASVLVDASNGNYRAADLRGAGRFE